MTAQAGPGTVLAVWTGTGRLADTLIRIGEALSGKPAVASHVVIITHLDQAGRWMGIQGEPGGVGMADCTGYLASPRTRGNYLQPRPGGPQVMNSFLASCAKSLGIAYDWAGIAEDTLDALRLHDLSGQIDPLWRWPSAGGKLPGHVVCSSLAAALYGLCGWAHPDTGTERTCEPADWWDWSDRQLWAAGG